jgi:integrase
MSRTIHGGAYESRGRYFLRVTVAKGKRLPKALPWVTAAMWRAHAPAGDVPCPCLACERGRVVQTLVTAYVAADADDKMVMALVTSAASADAEKLIAIRRAVEGFCSGKIPKPSGKAGSPSTFQRFAERWTGGELHRLYPDVVRAKRTADDDRMRLEKHVYPTIGGRELALVTLDDCLEIMRKLPSSLEPASRRHVAQLLSRVFALAVFPCRLIAASPIPRGFLPKIRRTKAKSALFADEADKLIACRDVPLSHRMLYAFVVREGMRSSEALAMTFGDLDLVRGAVRLDRSKTDEPRAWALDAGTAEALRLWRDMRGTSADDTLVFGVDDRGHLADSLRGHLEICGIKRAELFEMSACRRPLRFHDLRASFVTVALACDRTEGWISARTGHRSSGQIATYRRLAQTVADLGGTWFADMVQTIPELAEAAESKRLHEAAKTAARSGCCDTERPRESPNDEVSLPDSASVEAIAFFESAASTIPPLRRARFS